MADCVRHDWSGVGTGAVSLGPAVARYRAFPSAANGNTAIGYRIEHKVEGVIEVEVGRGTYTHSGTSLARNTVLFSTNGDALVDFSAGLKHVSWIPLFDDLSQRPIEPGNANYTLTDASGCDVTIIYTTTLTADRVVTIAASSLPPRRARDIRVLHMAAGGFEVEISDGSTITTLVQGQTAIVTATASDVTLTQHGPIQAGSLAAFNLVSAALLDPDFIDDLSTKSTLASGDKIPVGDASDAGNTKAISYADLLAQLTAAISAGGGENYDHVTDTGNYSGTAFQVGTGGADQNEWRKFSTVAAHKIHFPTGIPANSYGFFEVPEGSGTTFTSAATITVNGVADRGAGGAALTFPGTICSWFRADDGTFTIIGDIGTAAKAYANLDQNGFDIINIDSATFTEKAAADADVAAKGQFWVKSDTPNNAYFTDDTGVDINLSRGFVPLAGGTMSGELVMADQLLTRAYLKDTAEVLAIVTSSASVLTLDLTTANAFRVTLNGENVSTLTITNWPASGRLGVCLLFIQQDSTPRTFTFSSVTWAGGASAPPVSTGAGDIDIFAFLSRDGGSTIRGFNLGQAF